MMVFGLQGVVMWIISLPLQFGIVASNGRPSWLVLIGVCVWFVGFFFEAVGDWQLAVFRADRLNRGKVLQTGLWKYTRHPNYFGDCCIWWGFYLVGVAQGAPWWCVISPLLMSIFLVYISGVALLERDLFNKKPDYSRYASRTNAFFPGLPRRGDVD